MNSYMVLTTFYFQLHQPFRLNPDLTDSKNYFWSEIDADVYRKVARKCYVPATKMFTELVRDNPDFRMTMSFSGTLIDQAKLYSDKDSDIIPLLQELYDAGKTEIDGKIVKRVEFLDETHYHSLAGLFKDSDKREFREQVSKHGSMMLDLFGERPNCFRNTELMFNNSIADVVSDMGYKSIFCEKRADMFDESKIGPDSIFRAKNSEMLVLPRNRELSDDVAYRFTTNPLTADEHAKVISEIPGEYVLLGYDYEHIGEHIDGRLGIFDFWRHLPRELAKYENIVLANPSELVGKFGGVDLPRVDIHPLSTSSWADELRDTKGWIGNRVQYDLFKRIEAMENAAHSAGGEILENWRRFTTSDTLYYLFQGVGMMDDGKMRLEDKLELKHG